MVITAGEVGGVSVIGETLFTFSIENRSMGQPAGATLAADLAAILTAVGLIPTTVMRGTDSGALAAVCTEGRLAELDAGNLPTDIAAIPTTMVGTDDAALASVCTEARLAELAAANLPADVDTLLGRVTAAVALASVCTEARLAELAAANLPADIDTLLGRVTAAVALASVCTEARLAELDAGNIPTDLASISAAIGALNNLSAAGVNAEMVDVLTVDTIAELAQGIPASTPTVVTALALLYMSLRNRHDVDETAQFREIYNDAGVVITKKATSDDGNIYTEGKMESGP